MSETHPFVGETLQAYAKSLVIYHAAEKAFTADPTPETVHAYHRALDRFHVLRDEVRHAERYGDALLGTEKDEWPT